MDQIQIGKFISKCRKEKNLTQSQLAERLGITDKAISKWETGKGMPDASLMLELCNVLDISANELLSGERLSKEEYEEKANENIIHVVREADKNRKTKNRMIIIGGIILFVLLIYFAIHWIYTSLEISLSYDERIMKCDVTDTEILYHIEGLSIANSQYQKIDTDTETLIFFTSKIYLQNKTRSHFESWDSMAQLNSGEKIHFSSILSLDRKNCKEKIYAYYTNVPLKKIKQASSLELEKIIDQSYLMKEN